MELNKEEYIKYLRGFPFPVAFHIWIRRFIVPWNKVLNEIDPADEDILDLGCGYGLTAFLLRQSFSSCKIIGFESDADKIRLIERNPNFNLDVVSADQLNGISEGFDTVLVADVLYCNSKETQNTILSKCHQVLKKQGKLVLKETVSRPRHKLAFNYLQELVTMRWLGLTKASQINIPSVKELNELLDLNGFDIVEQKKIDYYYPWPHYLIVARKRI